MRHGPFTGCQVPEQGEGTKWCRSSVGGRVSGVMRLTWPRTLLVLALPFIWTGTAGLWCGDGSQDGGNGWGSLHVRAEGAVGRRQP